MKVPVLEFGPNRTQNETPVSIRNHYLAIWGMEDALGFADELTEDSAQFRGRSLLMISQIDFVVRRIGAVVSVRKYGRASQTV